MENEENRVGIGIKDFEEYDKNPFMNGAIRDIGIVTKDKISLWRTSKGSVMEMNDHNGNAILLGSKKKIDAEGFTKVYHKQIKFMLELSDSAIKMIIYIASKLEKNSLQIDFEIDDCNKICKFSRSTIYRLLTELLKFNVIARSSKRNYIYFINPIVLFNGNRLIAYQEWEKTEDDELNEVLELPYDTSKISSGDEIVNVNLNTGEIITNNIGDEKK